MTTKTSDTDDLKRRANRLRLYGLLSRWDELCTKAWAAELIDLEEVERRRRSHQYRIHAANIGDFKPIVDFDWKHPTKVDRKQIETLFGLGFLDDHENVVIVGPNGLGCLSVLKCEPAEGGRAAVAVGSRRGKRAYGAAERVGVERGRRGLLVQCVSWEGECVVDAGRLLPVARAHRCMDAGPRCIPARAHFGARIRGVEAREACGGRGADDRLMHLTRGTTHEHREHHCHGEGKGRDRLRTRRFDQVQLR